MQYGSPKASVLHSSMAVLHCSSLAKLAPAQIRPTFTNQHFIFRSNARRSILEIRTPIRTPIVSVCWHACSLCKLPVWYHLREVPKQRLALLVEFLPGGNGLRA